MGNKTIDSGQIFHPIEQAILCDWLGRKRPPVVRDIDLKAQVDGPADGPVTLANSSFGDIGEFALANAVARLVLAGIQQRLPTTAICYPDLVVLTRDFYPKTRRKLDLLPRFLFQINWASSAPGISWPVAYYVTWLPVYDVFVVTESADSDEGLITLEEAWAWAAEVWGEEGDAEEDEEADEACL